MKSLSEEEQRSLFFPLRHLVLFESGLKSVAGFDRATGDFVSYQISPELAKWAVRCAKRIKEAEDSFGVGDYQKALSKFEDILKEIPDSSIVMMDIGVCYNALGDKQASQLWLEKALIAAPAENKNLVQENLNRLKSRQPETNFS